MSGFKRHECTCAHTAKGHKRSGRCVKTCECKAALHKSKRKPKR